MGWKPILQLSLRPNLVGIRLAWRLRHWRLACCGDVASLAADIANVARAVVDKVQPLGAAAPADVADRRQEAGNIDLARRGNVASLATAAAHIAWAILDKVLPGRAASAADIVGG